MLRVRPILFVSDIEPWARLLEALGLICTVEDGDWREYDAGLGRLALHRTAPGTGTAPKSGVTVFGVEVGDLAEFARRTLADGTEALVVDTDHGQAVRITGRDGFAFLADKAAHGATCADADPALSVVGIWVTPDVDGAATDLRNIGARPRSTAEAAADFSTKNGGILAVRRGEASGAGGVEFEYDGGLEALEQRLASAGIAASVLSVLPGGRVLEIHGPDGVVVTVRAKPRAEE